MAVLTLTNSYTDLRINVNSQNIISIGRLVEKKGHHISHAGISIKIKHKFPNATLTIIGGGELEEYIKSLANNLI